MEKTVTFELCTIGDLLTNYRKIFELDGALTSKTFTDVLKFPGLEGAKVKITTIQDAEKVPARKLALLHLDGKEEYFFIYSLLEDLKRSKVIIQQHRAGIKPAPGFPYTELNFRRRKEQFKVAS